MEVLQHNIERISEWFSGLLRGEILIASDWTSLETFEAQNAIGMLAKLKPGLKEAAKKVSELLIDKNKINSEDAKLLFSNLTRSSYAREIYLRGFILYGEAFNNPEIVNSHQAMLPAAIDHTQLISRGVSIFRDAGFDLSILGEGFISTLFGGCDELAAIFRTHVQDINLLCCNYNGGLNYGNLDFDKDEASQWLLAGVAPNIAGYWRAYDFEAQEALQWLSIAVGNPAEARAWKSQKLNVATIKPWKELGFSLNLAMPWVLAGYQAQTAKEQIEKGILTPPPQEEVLS